MIDVELVGVTKPDATEMVATYHPILRRQTDTWFASMAGHFAVTIRRVVSGQGGNVETYYGAITPPVMPHI